MRLIAVSVLSIFATIPAFSAARLPVVNVGSGSVSARAAFGEKPAPVSVQPVSKGVVARASVKENNSDVLSPRRPTTDLWARSEKPLRLPEPQEFLAVQNDYSSLPEEGLDSEPRLVARSAGVMPASTYNGAGLDAEIAKLVELQRRAEESVSVPTPVVVSQRQIQPKPSNIVSYDAPRIARNAMTVEPMPKPQPVAQPARYEPAYDDNEPVSVRRMVIPMGDDVVVRAVNDNRPSYNDMGGADQDFAKLSPGELKKAFKKTYLSENKHLSTYQIDERFDVASDISSSMEGFTSTRDLSEAGGVRTLEIKIGFRNGDSALSRDNYNLLSEYASLVVSNPKRAIQVSIPQHVTRNMDDRKLAARRLAIVEQVLRDTGVSEQRIMPVLGQRNDDGFVLRVISSDQFEVMTQQKRDMFGDTVSKKTYKSMSW